MSSLLAGFYPIPGLCFRLNGREMVIDQEGRYTVSANRDRQKIPYQKILVPLDGSRLAEQALPHAVGLAQVHPNSVLYLLSVVPAVRYGAASTSALSPYIPPEYFVDPQETQQTLEKSLHQYLNMMARQLYETGGRIITCVRRGDPADAIIEYASLHGVDLIVMSTHGRSGMSRWVLGSVADKVVRNAVQPVLLIRGVHP